MKRIVSFLFVLVMVFSALSVPVNAIVADEPVGDIEKIDMFEYYYKNNDTFEILESALKEYNDKYGYKTEGKIRMGSGDKEFTAAEFDEEKIVIYCSFIEESQIKERDKYKQIEDFYDFVLELTDNDLSSFEVKILNHNSYMYGLIWPVFYHYASGLPEIDLLYIKIEPVLLIMNKFSGVISLVYLIYVIINLIYSKINKKCVKNKKIKVILSLLSIYIIFFGITDIVVYILRILDFLGIIK